MWFSLQFLIAMNPITCLTSRFCILLTASLLVLPSLLAQQSQSYAWKPFSSPPPILTSVVANSTGTVIVAGESGAFISLTTGATWAALNNFPPGRLKVSSSGDFFVFGAAVWKFSSERQRFEQLALGNGFTGAFRRALGFVTDMETSTNGTLLLLATEKQGVVRLPVTTIATIIVSVATITSTTAQALAVNPLTGEMFGRWNNSFWSSTDNGITWQTITNANISWRTARMEYGKTRLLPSGGNIFTEECSKYPPNHFSQIPYVFNTCVDAAWERDGYILFATERGIFAERTDVTTATSIPLQSSPISILATPLQPSPRLRVMQFAESGNIIFAATNYGLFCAEERFISKANPFLEIPQKILLWRECNNGLPGLTENISFAAQFMSTNSPVSQGWMRRDVSPLPSVRWERLLQDSIVLMPQIQTQDSTVLGVLLGKEQQGIVRTSLERVSNNIVQWTNATYTLPRGYVWAGETLDSKQSRAIQPMLRTNDGTLLLFARDTTTSRLALTHVASSKNDGRSWVLEEILGSGTAGSYLGKIRSSPRGFLFAEDRVFARNVLFRSADNGKTWQTLALGRVPQSLTIHPTTGTLFVAGAPPLISRDNGTTWEASLGLPFRSSSRFEGTIEFAFGTNETVVLNVRNLGLFVSTNAGVSFQLSSPLLQNIYALHTAPNGDFYALSQTGVWFLDRASLTQTTATWQQKNNGLSGIPNDILLHSIATNQESVPFLSTSRGLFRLENMIVKNSAMQTESAFPNNVILASAQNSHHELSASFSPNPAQDQSLLTINVPKPVLARLSLVNMRGDEVLKREIWCGSSGMIQYALNVQRVPQGQYLCRIQVEGTICHIVLTVLH